MSEETDYKSLPAVDPEGPPPAPSQEDYWVQEEDGEYEYDGRYERGTD